MSTASSSIGPGSFVRGSIRGEGDLEVEGRVEGSIEIDGELVIAESALIKSDVHGRNVVVRGAVAGSVSATESIVLEAGARVVGDLSAPRIGIRPGGLVKGHISTSEPRAEPKADASRARAAAPAARPAPVARPMIPRPAPAPPAPAKQAPKPAPVPAPVKHEPPPAAKVEPVDVVHPIEDPKDEFDPEATTAGELEHAGPPPPVVPAIKKGQKAQIRRKGAR